MLTAILIKLIFSGLLASLSLALALLFVVWDKGNS